MNKIQHKKDLQYKSIVKKKTVIIPEKKNSFALPLIIAFCVPVLLYLQTVTFGFTYFDDDGLIIKNIDFLKNFGNIGKAFLTDAFIIKMSSFYRPLQTLSYMVDIQLSGGNNPWMFHLSNIVLIGAISCSLFILLRKFSIQPKLALLGTLIYCIHPLFVSSIAWIPAIGDLMLTLFSLLSFLFLIEFLQNKKMIFLFLNWAAFTIALFCKETAALLPIIFIIYYFLFITKIYFEKRYLLMIMLYSISGIFWFYLRSTSIGHPSDNIAVYGLSALLLNIRTIPESIAVFLLPFDIASIPNFSILKTLIGLVIIVAIIFLFIKDKQRTKKEKIFCFAWFLIFMLPPMFYKSIWIEYLNHRFFMPLIGILLFALFIFPKKWLVKGDLKISWLVVVVIIILCSFTFIKSSAYSDPMTFYNSVISQNPNCAMAYNNRGNLRNIKGNMQGALDDCSKAIELYPKYYTAYFGRGVIKANMGDNMGAIKDYDEAVAIYPEYKEAYNNRGLVKSKTGNIQGALDDYNKAIAIYPNYVDAYNNRGNLKSKMGDNLGAIADFNIVITTDNKFDKAYCNRGFAKLRLNDFKDAIDDFDKYISLRPNNLEGYGNRAIARYNIKDYKGTIEDCNKILEFNPHDKTAIEYRAKAQQELQKNR